MTSFNLIISLKNLSSNSHFGRDTIQSITKLKVESVYGSTPALAELEESAARGPRAARKQELVKQEAHVLGILKVQHCVRLILLRVSGYCSLSRCPVIVTAKSVSNLVLKIAVQLFSN